MNAAPDKPLDFRLLAIGTLVALGGGYLVLAGLALIPPPSRINGPGWLGAACGAAFFLGGISVALRAILKMDDRETDLPKDAPLWVKLTFWLSGVGMVGCLAAVGTWVAIGPGERHFNVTGFIHGPLGDGIGRVVFGIGAILTWIAVIAFARVGYRKIFPK